MIVDSQTLRDLEIFESQTGGSSLFDVCNLTRTPGGATALRRRMARPWSDPDRIRATQDALEHIVAHRQAFSELPAVEYSTSRVERYERDLLYLITHQNALEFAGGILRLLFYHDRDYYRIVRGVEITSRFINNLRAFVRQEQVAASPGELSVLLDEMKALLAREKFGVLAPDDLSGWGFWRVLRTDQAFRLHEKSSVFRLLQLTYEIDALVSLADFTRQRQYPWPSLDEGALRASAEDLVHPLVRDAVPNSVELDQDHRLLFLTGPNMAGKTTYLRAFATALYMAHLGMGVPARRFRFVPAQYLISSITHRDDLRGISYFRAEALRVRSIAEALASGHRVVAILDEPFKGTNVKDALDASFAILERLAARQDGLFIFSSHLIELHEPLSKLSHVDFRCFEANESEERLRFEYLLRPGISNQRLGMRVLREEGIFDLLDKKAES